MATVKSYQIHEGGIGMSFTKDPFNGLFFIDYEPAPGTQVNGQQNQYFSIQQSIVSYFKHLPLKLPNPGI